MYTCNWVPLLYSRNWHINQLYFNNLFTKCSERIPILKDDAVKVLHSVCQQIWKTQQWLQDWKRSVFILDPKKGNAKDSSNYCTIAHISPTSKILLKILQARPQQYMNRELTDVQAGFRKVEEPDLKLPTSAGSSKKQESSRKTSISALLTTPEPLTVWITINCGKFFKWWESQTTWPAFKQQLELDREKQTGSKSRKAYIKTVYCHPDYLTYTQSTSWEILGRINKAQAGIKIAWRNNNLRYADDTTLMAESEEDLKILDESERGEWKNLA